MNARIGERRNGIGVHFRDDLGRGLGRHKEAVPSRCRRLQATLRPLPSHRTGLPDYPNHLSDLPRPLPRRIERVLMSIASLIDG